MHAKDTDMRYVMRARMSRRTLFKGLGATGLGLAATSGLVGIAGSSLGRGSIGQGPLLRQVELMHAVAMEDESVQQIIDIAITAEALAVTLLGGAITGAQAGHYDKPFPNEVVSILQAARAEEQVHHDYLLQAGAQSLTDTFTIPDPTLLSSYDTLFSTIVKLETAFVAAYMAAATRFAELDQTELVKVAYQIAGTEAEHRVLANYALGDRPANDLGFYPALFETVGDAAQTLQDLGFIGGDGQPIAYPGPGTIDMRMVTNTAPGGPSVTCTLPATGQPTDPTDPQQSCAYFEQTHHNVCGVFRDFWEKNGDVPVFGLPLTEAFEEMNFDTGETNMVQYFERQRFEHHPENRGTPYEVLLGRLGAQILSIQKRDWRTFPQADPSAMHYVAETGHAIAPEFWDFWRKYGLNYGDDGVSMRESLLLFGYPLSEPATETNQDGDTVLTQWFERAVFEYHPNNDAANQVLLRRLGAELIEHRT
jgi:hypothetical protein